MADRLTHIYTKTGDDGETSLGNGQRVKKNSIRVECLGSIDELNSIIGFVKNYLKVCSYVFFRFKFNITFVLLNDIINYRQT